ncbi:AbgT family transporter [Vibrio lentus]|nr:AbgT family transporter [Vibrio lentus]
MMLSKQCLRRWAATMGAYIVMSFLCSVPICIRQLIVNIGTMLALYGAEGLKAMTFQVKQPSWLVA